jgi:hypothetical protein
VIVVGSAQLFVIDLQNAPQLEILSSCSSSSVIVLWFLVQQKISESPPGIAAGLSIVTTSVLFPRTLHCNSAGAHAEDETSGHTL